MSEVFKMAEETAGPITTVLPDITRAVNAAGYAGSGILNLTPHFGTAGTLASAANTLSTLPKLLTNIQKDDALKTINSLVSTVKTLTEGIAAFTSAAQRYLPGLNIAQSALSTISVGVETGKLVELLQTYSNEAKETGVTPETSAKTWAQFTTLMTTTAQASVEIASLLPQTRLVQVATAITKLGVENADAETILNITTSINNSATRAMAEMGEAIAFTV